MNKKHSELDKIAKMQALKNGIRIMPGSNQIPPNITIIPNVQMKPYSHITTMRTKLHRKHPGFGLRPHMDSCILSRSISSHMTWSLTWSIAPRYHFHAFVKILRCYSRDDEKTQILNLAIEPTCRRFLQKTLFLLYNAS